MRYPKHVSILIFTLYALTACGPGQVDGGATLSKAVYDAKQAQQRSDFVVYHNDTPRFEMQLPREWYVGDVSSSTFGVVATNTNDASQPRAMVAVVAEPIGPDFELEQAFERFTASFKSQPGLSDFRGEGERSAVVNGLAGREAYFSYLVDDIAFRHRAVVLQAGETFYGISYAAPAEMFAGNESLFNSMLPTFKAR